MSGKVKIRYCCVCASENQNCVECHCARSGLSCRRCRKGDSCKNKDHTNSENSEDNEKRETREILERKVKKRVKSYEESSNYEDPICDEKIIEDEIGVGSHVTNVEKDGNCLFRCIAYAVHGDQGKHKEVREAITNFMRENKDFCRKFIHEEQEGYDDYVRRMSVPPTWGTDAEILVAAKTFEHDIFVHRKGSTGWEWLRYDGDLEDCNHEKKYIALDLRNDHFRHVNCKNRPCDCLRKKTQKILSQHDDNSLPSPAPSTTPITPSVPQTQTPPHHKQVPQTIREDMRNERGNFVWKDLTKEAATRWVDNTYREIVGWSANNLFEPPKCAATTKLIKEMVFLLNNYNQDTPLAPLALKIFFILPKLFFQKTHKKSKTRENVKAVTRRIDLWQTNNLDELLEEARTIQNRLPRLHHTNTHNVDKARNFANKMRHGKVAAALRALDDEQTGGVLPLNKETIDLLKEKHPEPSDSDGLRLPGHRQTPNSVIYEMITGELVWKIALQTQGSSGPSGLDANGTRRLLSNTIHGSTAVDLCNALASLARKTATSPCHHLDSMIACRLIPLDKKPGCRPIGIGEVIRRIIGKCIMAVVKDDVTRAAGNLQVCAGQQAGGEAAIHAMRTIFEHKDCEAVLLVDAKNAFNSMNRKTMLHNVGIKCPTLAMYAENTYNKPSDLYIDNSTLGNGCSVSVIKSKEGTTQGDPIAMAVYALGLSVLQDEIAYEKTNVKQVAYADDLSGAGKIIDLKKWWDMVNNHGPTIGYTPNAAKSVLIVKPEQYDFAVQTFRGSDVVITMEGQRHLGAVIGTPEFKKEYVEKKVAEWVQEVGILSDIAKTEPHAAYAAYTFGLQHRWNFVMRTIPDISPLLKPLENTIKNIFLPVLIKSVILTDDERDLLALPPSLGGMGITSPIKRANEENSNSINLTRSLTEKIVAQDAHGEIDQQMINEEKKKISRNRQETQMSTLERLKISLPPPRVRKVLIAQETGASNWLTSLPIRAKGFSLNKQEFVDAVALRYDWPMEGLPNTCVCGLSNNVSHTMTCKRGGFVCIRHDEVRDLTASLLREICRDVTTEPSLLPLDGEHLRYRTANTTNEARVDISARGFWTPGQKAFMDIRIFDPMAACHQKITLDAAHKRNESEKIRAYGERIQHVDQGTFTPLVFTTSGGMGPKAKCFYSRLADIMAEKKHQPRNYVVAWMRCRLSFSLLRSALLCLRGTRYSSPATTDTTSLDYQATVVESGIRVAH